MIVLSFVCAFITVTIIIIVHKIKPWYDLTSGGTKSHSSASSLIFTPSLAGKIQLNSTLGYVLVAKLGIPAGMKLCFRSE